MKKRQDIIIIIVVIILILGGLFLYLNFSKKDEIESIQLKIHNIKLEVGAKEKLIASITPNKANNAKVTWSSSNDNIVSVDSNGMIIANSPGIAIIDAQVNNLTDSCVVEVIHNNVEKIELNFYSKTMQVGDETRLVATITPSNANVDVLWESSNKSVATVDNNGNVKAISKGNAVIKAYVNNKEITCQINVNEKNIPVKNIVLDNDSLVMNIGDVKTINAVVIPNDATDKELSWSSSDTNIISVNQKGQVEAKSVGDANVVVTSKDGNVKVKCKVSVNKKKSNYVIVDDSKYKIYSTIASYSSNTLKYRIVNVDKTDFVLIWVDDANKQINNVLAYSNTYGEKTAGEILNYEVQKAGLFNKGAIAINSCFTWDNTPGIPLVLSKGIIARDVENKTYPRNMMYTILGIDRDGLMKTYIMKYNDYNYNMSIRKQILDDGIKNTFAIYGLVNNSKGSDVANRTQLCQYDQNNFVILSGEGTINESAKKIDKYFNCKNTYNLDGGGSRKLYYKTNMHTSMIERFGGERLRPNMLVISE